MAFKASPGKRSTRGPVSQHQLSKPGMSAGSKATKIGGIRTPYVQSVGRKMGGGGGKY